MYMGCGAYSCAVCACMYLCMLWCCCVYDVCVSSTHGAWVLSFCGMCAYGVQVYMQCTWLRGHGGCVLACVAVCLWQTWHVWYV
jgi:hypothetical protein